MHALGGRTRLHGHGRALEVAATGGFDVVVSCAFDPRLKREPYDPELDFDLRLAQTTDGAARFIMLSTRKVYGAGNTEPARVEGPALGQDTYGRNKRETERRLGDLLGERLTVLRLSNVAGFEYPEPGRRTFLAMLLTRLKREGTILYDMDPAQPRDFIPLDRAAALLAAALRRGEGGVFNAGSGLAVPVGRIAEWVMAGFGGGKLLVQDRGLEDRFVLDMGPTHAAFPQIAPLTEAALQCHFEALGRRLRAAPAA